jgi:hypothetical protein
MFNKRCILLVKRDFENFLCRIVISIDSHAYFQYLHNKHIMAEICKVEIQKLEQ